MDLKNKLVLITGASSGIGEAAAKLLAQHDAEVILLARSKDKLERVASEIESKGGKAHVLPVDLSIAEEVRHTASLIIQQVGIPDILINNAGAGQWLSIEESKEEDFRKMIEAPYLAAAYVTQAFIKYMIDRNSGQIITINSAACYFTFAGALGYISSRWALRGFTDALRDDLFQTNIKVSMIVAAKVDSPYFTNNPGSEDRIPKIAVALAGTLTVDEVARAILKTIRTGKKTTIIPWVMALSVWLNRFFPGIFRILMRKTGYKVKNQGN